MLPRVVTYPIRCLQYYTHHVLTPFPSQPTPGPHQILILSLQFPSYSYASQNYTHPVPTMSLSYPHCPPVSPSGSSSGSPQGWELPLSYCTGWRGLRSHSSPHFCMPQVKWIISSVAEVKQIVAPDYRNMIGQGA